MELILKRISDLPQQAASSLTGNEFTLISNNGVIQLVPLSAIYQYAQSQLSNVANLSVVTISDIQNADFTDTYITYDLLAQAIQSLGVLLTPSQQQALLQHLVNYNNPHRTTAEQVGLGNVANLPVLTQSDLTANNFGNKYITYNILQAAVEALGFNDLSNVANYPPTTLADIQNGIFGQTYLTYNLLSQAVQSLNIVLPPLLRTEFLQHLTNYNNPHQTTATQIGLGKVVNLPVLTEANIQANDITLEAYVTYNLLGDALASLPNSGTLTASQKQAFLAHLVDYSNPHQDNAASVGLGNVANLLPISNADITNVSGGGTPPDVYVTFDLLALANSSLGYKPLNITEVLISGSAASSTVIDITLSLLPAAGVSLTGSSLAIQYKETSSSIWQLATTVSYSGSNTITQTLSGLTAGVTYDIQVTMSNSVNTSVSAVSNTLVITTLGAPTTSTSGIFSYDIISTGGGATSPFDATTVNAGNSTITNNQAIINSNGSSVLMQPLIDPAGDGNFTKMNPTMTIIPGTIIVPLSGSTTNTFLITQSQYDILAALPSSSVLSLISNGIIYNYTLGAGITLNDTISGLAVGIVLGSTSYDQNTNLTQYYSGLNGSGSIIGSNIVNNTGFTNYYSGGDGSGNFLGSSDNMGNYFTGVNGGGSLMCSSVQGAAVPNGSGSFTNYYSGPNGSGIALGSSQSNTTILTNTTVAISYYSGLNGTGNFLGYTTDGTAGGVSIVNYYDSSGKLGLNVNQFCLPFAFGNYNTNIYSLTLGAGTSTAVPTAIFVGGNRSPVGAITSSNTASITINIPNTLGNGIDTKLGTGGTIPTPLANITASDMQYVFLGGTRYNIGTNGGLNNPITVVSNLYDPMPVANNDSWVFIGESSQTVISNITMLPLTTAGAGTSVNTNVPAGISTGSTVAGEEISSNSVIVNNSFMLVYNEYYPFLGLYPITSTGVGAGIENAAMTDLANETNGKRYTITMNDTWLIVINTSMNWISMYMLSTTPTSQLTAYQVTNPGVPLTGISAVSNNQWLVVGGTDSSGVFVYYLYSLSSVTNGVLGAPVIISNPAYRIIQMTDNWLFVQPTGHLNVWMYPTTVLGTTTTASGSQTLGALTVNGASFNSSNGAITYTYDPITGNGTSALTGFQDLLVNDIVVEFKGTLVN